MRVLFLHNNFPAQFRHVATLLAKDPNNEIVFGTKTPNNVQIEGVRKVMFKTSRDAHPSTHHYVRSLENAVLHGQAVYRLCIDLKKEGFVPDLICGHSGWGPTLFVKDVFPDSPLLCYFEWYYNARGSDADFDPKEPLQADDYPRIRSKNSPILLDIAHCDWGLSPTYWQRDQFPKIFHPKMSVLHDGVNTEFFKPVPNAKLVLPDLDLSHVDEIVTYVARGMEPYRGFPQFIEALGHLQKMRPNCHAVILGENRVCYGKPAPKGTTYKDMMLEKVPLDMSRVHFTGGLPYGQYLKVIQASSVHVYLTRPFVLSWSMIESMSTGCLVLGSDTQPVREVIEDGKNGLLVDFFSPKQIADRICEVLDHPDRMAQIRQNARETVLERYAHADLLQKQIQLLMDLADGRLPPSVGGDGVAAQLVASASADRNAKEKAETAKKSSKQSKKKSKKNRGFKALLN
ncbi:glycosyl transferase group 1 [Thalassoporum mexicanum PCC 7367]|uniref:glycosyltransferase family 4 protein n=1 Tax=Thalassoporum mexicanum TaxID=3457544 RepID=UPI00029FC0F6|nr:glycosyltransferase family 4 protein [Pseudanabaena sp. PCC 7367]AFY70180.1 glycosyl transferase group 1 [Pseudanabaena sp. PCC 7367]